MHEIDADWVLPGNGAAALLTWAGRELAQHPCWLLTPAFSDYARAVAAFAGQVIEVPLQQQHWPTDPDWAAALTAAIPAGTDLSQCSLLLNNPHNPTGALLSREAIRPFLETFGLVVVDEAFMDFLPPSQQQSLIAWVESFPNLVVLRSLTKFYSLPGLRMGYAVAHPHRLRRWQQWRDPWSVNTLAAAAAIAALQDTDFQQQTWDWLGVAKPDLYAGLAALPGLSPRPGSANFLLVDCDCPSPKLQKQLLIRHRIYIRDCSSFAEIGDRAFRVAVKTGADHQRLLAGLADVLSDGVGE